MMTKAKISTVVETTMRMRGAERYKPGAKERIFQRINPEVIMSPALVDLVERLLKEEEV
jgi:hypothetical protein